MPEVEAELQDCPSVEEQYDLDNLREKIDSLDSEIVKLLNERIEIVQKLEVQKKVRQRFMFHHERAVFEKIKGFNKGPFAGRICSCYLS